MTPIVRPRNPAFDRWSLGVLLTSGLALAMVAYFDLASQIPFLDEYARRWTIQQLLDGHGIQFWGRSPDLVQVFTGAIPGLLHLGPGTWRWSGLPSLLAEGLFSALIARRLGASDFWSAVAGACVAFNPLSLWLATGLMTETPFVAAFMACLYFGITWVEQGTGIVPCVAAAIVATLQRQQGLGLALALTVFVLASRGLRGATRRDLLGLAGLWLSGVGVVGLSEVLNRLTTAAGRGVGAQAAHLAGVTFGIYAVSSALPLLGFFILPLLAALVLRARGGGPWFPGIGAVLLVEVGLGFAWLISVPQRGSIFSGNIVNPVGLGPPFLAGKPALLAAPVFLLIELAASTAFFLALAWRQDWRWKSMDGNRRLLLSAAAIQFIAIFAQGQVFDRYYVVILACVVPIIAASIGRVSDLAFTRAWALLVLVLGVVYYGLGEQDYQAWQQARDVAARQAYAVQPPWQVAAGWEAEATYVWIPARDSGGTKPGIVVDHPALKLVFTGPDDPRPGVLYRSLAPGKIVIVSAGSGPIQH